MDIKFGRYVLRSDAYQYWVEESFTGETATGKEKTSYRRVSGYYKRLPDLMADFTDRRIKLDGHQELTGLMEELNKWRKETTREFRAILEEIEHK